MLTVILNNPARHRKRPLRGLGRPRQCRPQRTGCGFEIPSDAFDSQWRFQRGLQHSTQVGFRESYAFVAGLTLTLKTLSRSSVAVSKMLNNSYHALVVDDEPVAQSMIAFALGKEGFFCDHAADGAQASELLESRTYDLVVTDLLMPNKHGHSLAVALLASPHRPVIMIHSSVDDPRVTSDLLARGVDDFVYKPANYATVAARAKVLVDRRSQSNGGEPKPERQPRPEPAAPGEQPAAQPAAGMSHAQLSRRLGEVSEICRSRRRRRRSTA